MHPYLQTVLDLLEAHGPMSTSELRDLQVQNASAALNKLKFLDQVIKPRHGGAWRLTGHTDADVDGRVLAYVDGKRSTKDIARLLRWSKAAVQESLKRLVASGWLTRRASQPYEQRQLPATPADAPAPSPAAEPRAPSEDVAPVERVASRRKSTRRVMTPEGGGERKRTVSYVNLETGDAVVQAEGSVQLVGLVDEDRSERFTCDRRGLEVSAQSCHECLVDAPSRMPSQPARHPRAAAAAREMPGWECEQGWTRRFVMATGRKPSAPAELERAMKGLEVVP